MKYLFIVFLFIISFSTFIGISFASNSSIIITEVMYDPINSDPGHEWIELYNPTANTIEINNWEISDLNSNPHTENFSGVIESGEYFIIGRSLVLEADYIFNFDLNNSGEGIFLKDENGEIVDELYWKENGWVLSSGIANSGDTICRISIENIGSEDEWDTCSASIKSGNYILQEEDEGDNIDEVDKDKIIKSKKTSKRRKTQSVVFGCKDRKAKNYSRFVFHRKSFCKYEDNIYENRVKENNVKYFFIGNSRIALKNVYSPVIIISDLFKKIDYLKKVEKVEKGTVKITKEIKKTEEQINYGSDIMCPIPLLYSL